MKKSDNAYFEHGKCILRKIHQAGYEAYFVGGCVRDYILSLPLKDIDIATSATPVELKEIFPHLIPIGIEHETVLIRTEQMSFEISTYKTDKGNGCFKIDHESRTLKEDVTYRDFTMNTLAMDLEMNIIDYYDGRKDIQSACIRGVKSPVNRIKEDPLRIMRGIRFISMFGFSIEEKTSQGMKQCAHLLKDVAIERLLGECEKIFAYEYCRKAIHQMIALNIDDYLPIFKEEPTLLRDVLPYIQPLHTFAEVIALMHIQAPHQSVNEWCRRWNCSNKTKKTAKKLVHTYNLMMERGMYDAYALYTLGEDIPTFFRVLRILHPHDGITLDRYLKIKDQLPIHHRQDLALNGNDLMELFPTKRPGKWIEEMLSILEYKVVIGELSNDIKTMKEWIICNPLETN
ncbi:MAG TPA: CCA tRNA nucleotidyltransferase [Bacillota bacterium]|nr:CCA tRNA nucleotidyltransferase [Bacillota bacterium]